VSPVALAEALAELRRAPVHMLSVDAVGEVLRALVLDVHPGVEVLVGRAVARAHELEPWLGLQLLALEADASRFAPGCASVLRSQLRELSELAEAASRAQRIPAPPMAPSLLGATALGRLAVLDGSELARVDALATAQRLTRPAMLARLLALGSGTAAANDAKSPSDTTTRSLSPGADGADGHAQDEGAEAHGHRSAAPERRRALRSLRVCDFAMPLFATTEREIDGGSK
jgi:hypothetical protein